MVADHPKERLALGRWAALRYRPTKSPAVLSPSKYHVFAAVLTAQIVNLTPPPTSPTDTVAAVAEFMAGACRDMLRHKRLAHAMITSTQAVRAHAIAAGDHTVRDLIPQTAGVENPTDTQIRIARLVEQVTFGILTWTVGGEMEPAEAVADVRLACRCLIADEFG